MYFTPTVREDKSEDLVATVTTIDLDGKYASFILLTEEDDLAKIKPTFEKLVASVRRTRFGDAPGLREYKARRVQPSDTVASVGAVADFEADTERELRLLNGLDAGDPLPKDGWVKWVK